MIYSLCSVEDFDAVLQVIYMMEDKRVDLPSYTAHHVLDRASEYLHLDATLWVWKRTVEPRYINPSTGLCHNVLLTAARAGDKWLAEGVCRLLAKRQKEPSKLEWDLLEETYETAGDEEAVKEVKLRRKEGG